MKRLNRPERHAAHQADSSFADRVRDMREHFKLHGWYRSQDVRTVLGDPLERVQIEPRLSATTNDKKK